MISVKLMGSEVRTLTNNTTGAELSVIASRGMVFSCWRFSREELADVASGKPVWLIIRGEVIPELVMAVGDRKQVVPPDIIKQARKAEGILGSPAGIRFQEEVRSRARLIDAIAWFYACAILGAAVAFIWWLWTLI